MNLLSAAFVTVFLAQAPPAQAPAAAQPKPVAQKTTTAPASAKATAGKPASQGLITQVALDRAGYSPGAIDGSVGSGTKKALAAYKATNDGADPQIDEPTVRYVVTDADVAGPYEPKIPAELPDQAKLPAMSYKTLIEALAERFHSTPAFLQRLNRGAKFAAGEEITVPNVEPMFISGASKPAARPTDAAGAQVKPAQPEARGTTGTANAPAARGASAAKPDVVITVTKSTSALTVTDAAGKTLMYAPVTTGSKHDPLPIGEWKVNGVSLNPPFRYNPKLFWDADPTHEAALIKPGPNNPVGLVWIDLSKEHYGIHGSPEPATIGKTASHGCVRLTNWDALRLAGLVKPGTRVVFKP